MPEITGKGINKLEEVRKAIVEVTGNPGIITTEAWDEKTTVTTRGSGAVPATSMVHISGGPGVFPPDVLQKLRENLAKIPELKFSISLTDEHGATGHPNL